MSAKHAAPRRLVSAFRVTILLQTTDGFLALPCYPQTLMSAEFRRFKTLFLCTGNSARSILAEFLLRRTGGDLFEVYSAGVNPKSAPHPLALRTLQENYQIDVSSARSKTWEEFKDVHFDFIITLCDNARETCPVWPGQPITAHWSSADPSLIQGDDAAARSAFWQVAEQIRRRVELLASLPFEKLDSLRLAAETHAIGQKEHV